jgi:hypothetical protein
MSKPSLTSIDETFLQKLKSLPLFQHIGEDSVPETKFNQQRLNNVQEVNKQLQSIDWENFTLEARNRLTIYLHEKYPKEDSLWNTITNAYKSELLYFKPVVNKCMIINNLDEIFAHDFDWIFLAMCMENHYQRIAPRIPIFFQYFLPIYEAGHIPCGWNGRADEEYTGKPVDISNGILMVY